MLTNSLNETYLYNGDGTRIRKQSGSGTINYHYNQGSLYYTTDGVNQAINENIRSLGGKMIFTVNNNEFYNYLIDIRGSTSEIIDSNGEFNTFYRYSAFGETEVEVSPLTNPVNNEICYTGAIYDESTGLYYMNARYYDSANGRFVSQDSYRGSRDDYKSLYLYTYCSNDPVNNTDPSGHKYVAGEGGDFESLYSTLSNYQKDKLSKAEIKIAIKIPSIRYHFRRNRKNTGLPWTETEAKNRGWKKATNIEASCHQFNRKVTKTRIKSGWVSVYGPNSKYTKGKKEVVYYSDGTKNNSPEDRGSYNFAPSQGVRSIYTDGHVLKDMVPWVAWGNSSSKYGSDRDKTSTTTRYKKSSIMEFSYGPIGIRVIAKVGLYMTVG